jgi:pimeloyl-ACP methyl ester carboxylesterase
MGRLLQQLTDMQALALVLAGVLLASGSTQGSDVRPENRFLVVNGVRLHYIDWGGKGECLLFLTPLGGDLLEQFGSLAPQFTDRFRVLGLTRRGQGQSEKPAGDYDIDTLVRDIVGFLDAIGASQAHFAGHSLAGAEMTRLAVVRPSRVSKLVYLDAAVDYKLHAELMAEAGWGPPDDPALAAIFRGAALRHPEYGGVKAPALSIKVVFDGPIPVRPHDDEAYKKYVKLAEQRDIVGVQIRQFERGVARGETLLLRNTTHGGFLNDPAQQQVFVPAMREFLLRR